MIPNLLKIDHPYNVLVDENQCAIEKHLDSELRIKCKERSEINQSSLKKVELKIYETGLNEEIINNFYEVVHEEPILTHLNDKTFKLSFDEEIGCLETSTLNISSLNFNFDIDYNKNSLTIIFENEITEPYLSINLMGITFNLEIQKQISKVTIFLILEFPKFKVSRCKLLLRCCSLFSQHSHNLPKTTLRPSYVRRYSV
jgi:hypothetical protein